MKHSKRWLSLILSASMLVSLVPFNVFAEDEVSTLPQNIKAEGYFSYPSFGGEDYEAPFFYDDDYFTKSSYEYQDSLATMTLAMAQSAFGSTKSDNDEEGYKTKSQNLEKLLKDCGFPDENYETNQAFREKPTTDSIGVGASHKMITDDGQAYTLIAAAVRGGGYESEWASNFTLGESGAHKGFSEARDQVLSFLSEYIEDQDITGDVKLWITGYSRAAATTNLVAGAIDGGYILSDDISLQNDDLYAYCFECPQGASVNDGVDNEIYNNIFNIVNPGDVVTKIGPTKPDSFGFQRYGVNQYLPTALKEGAAYDELQATMLERYFELPSVKTYVVDDFQMKKLSINRLFYDPQGFFEEGIVVDDTDSNWDMNAFLDEALYTFFSKNVKSRQNYVNNYEEGMRELCHALFGCSDNWTVFEDLFIAKLQEKSNAITACLLLYRPLRLQKIVETVLEDALSEAGITDYSAKEIKSFAGKFVSLFLSFGISNPAYTATIIDNLESIGTAHVPEVCLAWLQSFDPNYTPGASSVFNSGVHRIVRVSGPADLEVYDGNDSLVASVSGDAVQDVEGSTIVSYINEEDETLVYLPADESYQVEVIPSENGTISYSVQEYSEEAGGVNQMTNYYDIDASAGLTYTGYVPGINAPETLSIDGSSSDYALVASDGNVLAADESMAGENALTANCEITASSADENTGIVTGTTIARVGEQAKVTAVPNEGYVFTGWYDNDTLVSEDEEYTFRAKGDVTLTAYFEAAPADTPAADLEVSYDWSEDYSTCSASFTSGDETSTLNCEIAVETIPATTEKEGQITYTASVAFNDAVYTDTKTVILPIEDKDIQDPEAQPDEEDTTVHPDKPVVHPVVTFVKNVVKHVTDFWTSIWNRF